ncbi:TetR/AcrR family transcriptional regulator [Solicola gregarius]|uniref:TetR/AcrR family transcriptional regulator n=1 Tax=Solicola gregarius TaxID=2908642 RepID=A0AA46TL24_9ACTN|nr:TetR/AcrR family transcriptional regulator [Solicola gregarius]UYM06889.1 TetR/AcrR family transcriptional regulator [Solicola gregarius]
MATTRDRILNAFEALLVGQGSRSATLDAVAEEAGVSKGGLLYHFPSRDDLVVGMLDRLRDMGAKDAEKMRSAPQGAVAYYLETSKHTGSAFDRAMIAAARISQESDARASSALDDLREAWFEVLDEQLDDDELARTVQLLCDALYFNETMGLAEEASMPAVRAILARLGALDVQP